MKLLCPECRRENEPERIYCHDCGAKLDRSALAKSAAAEEKPQETHKRLKSMFNPQGVKLRQNFFKTSKVILGALITAAVIQMALPPDLPPRTKALGLASQVGLELETAATRAGGPPLQYTEEQVNAYLAGALKSKQAALSGWLGFERAVVGLEEKACRLTVERSLFGYSVYTSGSYDLALQNGAFIARSLGGRIGRLPIHPQLMSFAGPLFSDVLAATDRDRKSLLKLGQIDFHPQTVTITPKQ